MASSENEYSRFFSVRDLRLLRDFSRNSNIIVCKPDKGNGVVVVDKNRYVDSIQTIISDQSKFQEITLPIQKYVAKIEDKIINFIRNLKNSKLLSDEYFKQMFTSGSGPGVLYGLTKITNLTLLLTSSSGQYLRRTTRLVLIYSQVSSSYS